MKTKNNNIFSYYIILLILIGFTIHFYNQSKIRITRLSINSFKAKVSKYKPVLNEYKDTDDIKFEIREFPNKEFKIDYTKIDFESGKKILSNFEKNKEIIIDVEKDYFKEKIKKGTFLGIKPSISILGIRQSEMIEIPISDYNIKTKSESKTTSLISFIGVLILTFKLIYYYVRKKIKNTTANTS